MARSSLLSPLLLSPLLALLLTIPAQATRLELADNLTLLASPQGQPSAFTRAIDLPAGESRLLVRFDSPSDPRSTNESQGRTTSPPLLVTVTLPPQGHATLTTPPLTNASAIRRFAAKPVLLLQTGEISAPLQITVLPRSRDHLFTDYQALLTSHEPQGAHATAPVMTRQETGEVAPALTPEQTDAALRQLYLATDVERRKAFIRWALEL